MIEVRIVSHPPSPHQAELFNALSDVRGLKLEVIYIGRRSAGREWRVPPLMHEHTFLREWQPKTSISINAGLRRALNLRSADLVIVCGHAQLSFQRAMALCLVRGVPFAFWSEMPGVPFIESPPVSSERLRTLVRRPLLKLPRKATACWAIGASCAEEMRRRGSTNVMSVPYFSNLADFLASPTTVTSQQIRAIFLGQLSYRKGADLAMATAREVCSADAEARFTFVGRGEFEPQALELAKNFPGAIEYHRAVWGAPLRALLSCHNIMLAPSRYDGWGMTVIEGLAAGLHVVSTDATNSARAAITASTGTVLSNPDTGQLVREVRRAASEWSVDAVSARQTAARKFDISAGAIRLRKAIYVTLELAKPARSESESRRGHHRDRSRVVQAAGVAGGSG